MSANPSPSVRVSPTTEDVALLRQGIDLLTHLDDALYTAAPPPPLGAVGGHFRHCLDFYGCFLRGLETGDVDYDDRRRDPRLEGERHAALGALRDLAAGLENLAPDRVAPDRPLRVSQDRACDSEGREAEDRWCRSTVGRELQFLRSHTIHHYALIAATLRLLGFAPDPDFGIAPSTLAHRREG